MEPDFQLSFFIFCMRWCRNSECIVTQHLALNKFRWLKNYNQLLRTWDSIWLQCIVELNTTIPKVSWFSQLPVFSTPCEQPGHNSCPEHSVVSKTLPCYNTHQFNTVSVLFFSLWREIYGKRKQFELYFYANAVKINSRSSLNIFLLAHRCNKELTTESFPCPQEKNRLKEKLFL